jgi:hypothetical protein
MLGMSPKPKCGKLKQELIQFNGSIKNGICKYKLENGSYCNAPLRYHDQTEFVLFSGYINNKKIKINHF